MSRGLTLLVLPSLLVLVACSEWRLSRRDTDCEDCDTDTDDGELSVCESRELQGASLEVVECEPEQGGWEARVLWETEGAENYVSLHGLVLDPADLGGTLVVAGQPMGLRVLDGATGLLLSRPDHANIGGEAAVYRADDRIIIADTQGSSRSYSTHDALTGELLTERAETDLRGALDEACASTFARLADLDGDGVPEWLFGTLTLSSDLSEISYAESSRNDGCLATAADMTGDGKREIITSVGVFRPNGTPTCLRGEEDLESGRTWVMDLNGDGQPEFASWTRRGRSNDLRFYDADCAAWPARPSGGGLLTDMSIGMIDAIAPVLEPGTVAIIAFVQGTETTSGKTFRGAAILDHNLTVRVLLGRPNAAFVRTADFDGDGVHEVIMSTVLEGGESAVQVLDSRTGDVLMELPGGSAFPVDVDGDGHLEILLATSGRLIAYNATNGEWAWGTRSWNQWDDFYPGLYLPDGSFAPPGRDWSRSGWYNAAANDGYLRGAGGELTVRIADVCDNACDRGRITAWVHPGNAGTKDVERPVKITLGATINGEEVLLDEEILATLPAGRELPALELQGYEIEGIESVWARIEPHGWHWEGCTERPDEDVWAEGVCE